MAISEPISIAPSACKLWCKPPGFLPGSFLAQLHLERSRHRHNSSAQTAQPFRFPSSRRPYDRVLLLGVMADCGAVGRRLPGGYIRASHSSALPSHIRDRGPNEQLVNRQAVAAQLPQFADVRASAPCDGAGAADFRFQNVRGADSRHPAGAGAERWPDNSIAICWPAN